MNMDTQIFLGGYIKVWGQITELGHISKNHMSNYPKALNIKDNWNWTIGSVEMTMGAVIMESILSFMVSDFPEFLWILDSIINDFRLSKKYKLSLYIS